MRILNCLTIICAIDLAASAALAADLDGMSRNQRESYCVANGIIDVDVRHEAGELSDQDYNRIHNLLVWEIQDKGDNYNYASDFRRLNQNIRRIVEARPSMQEIADTARQCQPILRIPGYR